MIHYQNKLNLLKQQFCFCSVYIQAVLLITKSCLPPSEVLALAVEGFLVDRLPIYAGVSLGLSFYLQVLSSLDPCFCNESQETNILLL